MRAIQDGFFLNVDPNREAILLPTAGGEEKNTPMSRAAALYLQVLRDATHGFGGKSVKDNARDDALIARHTGEIPGDLGLVAYLYMLELLTSTSRLRASIEGSRRLAK